MLKRIFREIKNVFLNNNVLAIISLILFVLGVVLGAFLPLNDTINTTFTEQVNNYYIFIIGNEFSSFSFFIKRILNAVIFLFVIFLLLTNKYTFYLSLLLLLYRGYIFGLSFKFFILKLGLNGLIFYIFTILIQQLFLNFAILLFVLWANELIKKSNCNYVNNLFKIGVYVFLISILGIIIEFIILNFILRPTNLYF